MWFQGKLEGKRPRGRSFNDFIGDIQGFTEIPDKDFTTRIVHQRSGVSDLTQMRQKNWALFQMQNPLKSDLKNSPICPI